MADETPDTSLLELATELTIAWLANPNTRVAAEEVPAFLERMHGAVGALAGSSAPAQEEAPEPTFTPAVTVRRSLGSKDHIISMIDGKPYKTLKRHLSGHGLTPAQYRERYGLKSDYPMVAESYAEMRRGLAKKIGLGRKPGAKVTKAPASATKSAAPKAAAPKAAVAQSAPKAAPKPKATKAPKPAKPAEAPKVDQA